MHVCVPPGPGLQKLPLRTTYTTQDVPPFVDDGKVVHTPKNYVSLNVDPTQFLCPREKNLQWMYIARSATTPQVAHSSDQVFFSRTESAGAR